MHFDTFDFYDFENLTLKVEIQYIDFQFDVNQTIFYFLLTGLTSCQVSDDQVLKYPTTD